MELSLSHLVAVVTVLVSVIPGNSEQICDFDKSCLHIYNTLKSMYEEDANDLATTCSLAHDLKDCMKKTSRRCRGDLNYHFFEKLVRDLNANLEVGKNCAAKASDEKNSNGSNTLGSGHHISHHNHHGKKDRNPGRDRCLPKLPSTAPTVGCALFGLTNLKSFSETLNFTDINYCSLSGAWNMIDTPEFSVQITNKGGLSPLPKDITATTLVTVLVKHSQCSDRKTYQATFDEVPGMFSDGYTTAGSVYIETITESEHVKIHFPYLMTTIDVIKVIDIIPIPSLSVVIKMPETTAHGFMSEPKRLRGLPLCFYGCPRTATMKSRSSESSMTARSASPTPTQNSYYKSKCPDPETVSEGSDEEEEEELPQADGASPSSSTLSSPRSPRKHEETEFSGSLSAEFLSQSSSFANNDFGGQRSQRSHSSNTAVICASLNSVHEVLSETTVVGTKLKFPGENFLDAARHHSDDDFSSASQSAALCKFHFLFMYSMATLIYSWR